MKAWYFPCVVLTNGQFALSCCMYRRGQMDLNEGEINQTASSNWREVALQKTYKMGLIKQSDCDENIN